MKMGVTYCRYKHVNNGNTVKPDIKSLNRMHEAKKVLGQSKLVEINKKKH